MGDAAESSVDWLLWQLADSAFPTGGFAHSGGLEAARQNGEIRNREDLREFLEAALQQTARAGAPFVLAGFERAGEIRKIDCLCDAFTSNHVANRASRLQGRALLNAVSKAFPVAPCDTLLKELRGAPCHLAPVFGAVMAILAIERVSAVRLFLFMQLRGWISSAVRLNVIGPLEAQSIQASLAPVAEPLARADYPLETAVQTAPILEILHATHDRLYSRLFQS